MLFPQMLPPGRVERLRVQCRSQTSLPLCKPKQVPYSLSLIFLVCEMDITTEAISWDCWKEKKSWYLQNTQDLAQRKEWLIDWSEGHTPWQVNTWQILAPSHCLSFSASFYLSPVSLWFTHNCKVSPYPHLFSACPSVSSLLSPLANILGCQSASLIPM